MKKFILEVIASFGILSGLITLLLLQADGNLDRYYLKFTTPRQASLILGSSRAAEGVVPEILNKRLSYPDVYNYAFNGEFSPYGPYYLESIKSKIDPKEKKGLFIICVNPKLLIKTQQKGFRESNTLLGKVTEVSKKPNFSYFMDYYPERWGNIIYKKYISNNSIFLHDDGWLEFHAKESVSFEKVLLKWKMVEPEKWKISEERVGYLHESIEFLKKQGEVFIVRIPAKKELIQFENRVMPKLDVVMDSISKIEGVKYFNFTELSDDYMYRDGNHLQYQSAYDFTEVLADSIMMHQKQ